MKLLATAIALTFSLSMTSGCTMAVGTRSTAVVANLVVAVAGAAVLVAADAGTLEDDLMQSYEKAGVGLLGTGLLGVIVSAGGVETEPVSFESSP